jgi:hypothetical protein
MEVGTGAASAQANVSEDVAPPHMLAGAHGEPGKVSEAGNDSVAVIENYGTTVAAHIVSKVDKAISRSNHGLADDGGNVDAGMEGAFAIEGINALAK